MTKLAAFILLLQLCAVLALGQVTEADLKAKYANLRDNVFQLTPTLKLRAFYGPDRQACALAISGPASGKELSDWFDTLVPENIRGGKGRDMGVCAGGCMFYRKFENVIFATGTIDNSQTSDPAAVITFQRSECSTLEKNWTAAVTAHITSVKR